MSRPRGGGVNFRSAGRGQVVVHSPGRRPGPGTRWSRSGAVAPSTHPKVPDTQHMSPGFRLGIRESMGWEKVCGSARSGIWVLHGDLKSRVLPANLHQSVRWRTGSTHDTALVHTRVVKEQQSNHKLIHSVECASSRAGCCTLFDWAGAW